VNVYPVSTCDIRYLIMYGSRCNELDKLEPPLKHRFDCHGIAGWYGDSEDHGQ